MASPRAETTQEMIRPSINPSWSLRFAIVMRLIDERKMKVSNTLISWMNFSVRVTAFKVICLQI